MYFHSWSLTGQDNFLGKHINQCCTFDFIYTLYLKVHLHNIITLCGNLRNWLYLQQLWIEKMILKNFSKIISLVYFFIFLQGKQAEIR